ncbi:MAG: signal peptidase I [Firmicutes bacterium]|jgi:signal peptidase I|nr:signal peptidase I [Bacillota bacterium]
MKYRQALREALEIVVTALVLAYLIQGFVVQSWIVDGPSMEPTLQNGERLFINKFVYRVGQPKRGDIVVFHLPRRGDRDFIKRVIGLPGETLEIRLGRVYINQQPIDEPYIRQDVLGEHPKITIPPGQVFVIGDNRPNSHDSRAFGPVPINLIRGRAFVVYWPPGRIRLVR